MSYEAKRCDNVSVIFPMSIPPDLNRSRPDPYPLETHISRSMQQSRAVLGGVLNVVLGGPECNETKRLQRLYRWEGTSPVTFKMVIPKDCWSFQNLPSAVGASCHCVSLLCIWPNIVRWNALS